MPQPALAPLLELDLLCSAAAYFSKIASSRFAVAASLEPERDLVVGLERAVVEVARPDRAPHAVDASSLSGAAACAGTRTDARRTEQLLEVAMAGVLHHRIVRAAGRRHHHAHVDAPLDSLSERLDRVGLRE